MLGMLPQVPKKKDFVELLPELCSDIVQLLQYLWMALDGSPWIIRCKDNLFNSLCQQPGVARCSPWARSWV